MWPRSRSRCGARCITSSSPSTSGPASPTWPAPRTASCSTRCRRASNTSRTNPSQSTFQGLFSEINLGSDKLGKTYADRNAKLCTIITEIAEGLAEFSTDIDALGDAYEYLIGQFAAGSGKKAGEFYTPQQISDILSAIVTLDSQEPADRQARTARQRARLRLRLRLAAAERAQAHGAARHRQDLRAGKEHHHLQPRAHEHAAARGEGHGVRNLPRRHADQRLGHAARD